ncbi:hypothetical protein ACFX1X_005242 [Malus domestica]
MIERHVSIWAYVNIKKIKVFSFFSRHPTSLRPSPLILPPFFAPTLPAHPPSALLLFHLSRYDIGLAAAQMGRRYRRSAAGGGGSTKSIVDRRLGDSELQSRLLNYLNLGGHGDGEGFGGFKYGNDLMGGIG